MQRQRDELVPISDAVPGLDDMPAIPSASPQARHHFTIADQVDQLLFQPAKRTRREAS